MKIQKTFFGGCSGWGVIALGGGGGQGGCERRIEVFMKIQKNFFWGVSGMGGPGVGLGG